MEMSLQTDESNKYDDKHVMGKVYQQVFKGDAAPEKQELVSSFLCVIIRMVC
jgi:hypothetical protein